MKSKTQQAVDWLTEETKETRTIAEAARKFGLGQPEGIGLALKKHRIKEAALNHDHAIDNGTDVKHTWDILRRLL